METLNNKGSYFVLSSFSNLSCLHYLEMHVFLDSYSELSIFH